MFDLCIKNGHIVNHNHSLTGNIYVKGEKIAAITMGGADFEARETIDCTGKLVMPGFVDPHAHLNDPGYTDGEDFYTGTCSAAAGGITTVMEHPLTDPLPSKKEILMDKNRIVGAKAVADYALFGACTPDNYEDIGGMADTGAVAFKGFLTSSPEMPRLSDWQVVQHMINLRGKGPLLPIHCENEEIIQGAVERLKKDGRTSPKDYCDSRPGIGEAEAIDRMCFFAERTGGKIHVVHCSIPVGIEIVESYKQKGVDVTVETCPHYLVFDQEDVERQGVYAICNPPIRNRADVELLWEKVLEGKVDFIGSDHAPYTFAEKEKGVGDVFETPAGLAGIQSGFLAFFSEGVKRRGMPLEQFAAMTSTNAAKRYGIFPKKGILAVGADADMVVIDPRGKSMVAKEQLFYKMKWTPYMGKELDGVIEKTILRGTTVYSAGRICVDPGFGRYVPREGGRP